ncbi:sugar kinase [Shimia ponticola]|uniref:sugar kinase n=1 Tax=Shimia ponticola TaxID=2582893 RepID=UPI002105F020|nr:sugar kinase [Shimia ponticola]
MTAPAVAIGCLGEVMLELVAGQGSQATLGVAGDTYNTAVYLRHVAPELRVDYITGLGSDRFSQRIMKHMAGYGVGHSRVFMHPTRGPGLYAIETDDTGERSFTYWRSDAAARALGDEDTPLLSGLLSGLTHVFLSGISLAILPQDNRDRLFAALADFRARGGIVAFDSNYRPHLWNDPELARRETERAWRSCDIGMPSVDDEQALFGDANEDAVLARFASYGILRGVLKRGALGPISFCGTTLARAEQPVKVVDTTAAGDSFNAGYLAELLRGGDEQTALKTGHDLATRVIGQRGAIIFKPEALA